jgi:Ca-activated chloride channel homolog
VLYRRDARLHLAECHEIRHRVRAATHSLIGVSYCVRRDMDRKDRLPPTFGIAFASMQCLGLGRNGFARRSQSRASNGNSQQRGIDHEIANFHRVVSHLPGTPPVDRVPVDSICALAHALDRSHMLSREFRFAFGRNSNSFSAFPRSAGDDGRYSATTISFRVLPCWFFSLALLAMCGVAQGTAAPERGPAPAGLQSSVSAMKDTSSVSIEAGHNIHVDVDLALVNVTVTDPYDRPVTGLDPSNFRVFENNVEQEVLTFSIEDTPISVGVIFDNSGSMADKIGKAREGVIEFFKSSNPEDEFFFVSFNERAELTSAFTNSIEDLQTRIMLTAPRGRTALLDAICLGLSQMRGARNSRRALLIISDGGDNNSRFNESDVKRLVREAHTQLYAIGIFDPLEYRSRTIEELNGPSLLAEITEMTGGRLFTVENPNELPDTAAKIGMELRNQYTLGYRPSNKAHDAKWRKIKIKVRPPKGLPPLKVYSKTGYYAPSP